MGGSMKRGILLISLLALAGCGDTVNNYYTTAPSDGFTNISTQTFMIWSTSSIQVPVGTTQLNRDRTVITPVAAISPDITPYTVCTASMNAVFDLYSTPERVYSSDDTSGNHSRNWWYPSKGIDYTFSWRQLEKYCNIYVSTYPPY